MRRLGKVLQEQYGEKVYKLSLSSGCSCPNRDGTLGTGGCSFCSAGGSGDFAAVFAPIDLQLEEAKARIRRKTDAKKFIAYFQSFTNTYGDPARLLPLYREVLEREEIVALSLGTRPDCLGEDVMAMLRELQALKPVWLELGLQTIHEETARRIHRGYPLPVFEESYRRLKREGFPVVVREPFPLLCLEEYTDLIAESAAILPSETVFHRITGDGPGKLLLAPDWTRSKKRVLNLLNTRLAPYEL